jgi:hypothetical protein
LVTGITIKTDKLESHLHAIERITSKEQDKTGQIIPIRFIIAPVGGEFGSFFHHYQGPGKD